MRNKSLKNTINRIDKFLESTDYESLDDFKKRVDKSKDPEELEKEIDYISLQANKPQSTNSTTKKQDDEAKLKYARDKYLDKHGKDISKASSVEAKAGLHESLHDTWFQVTYEIDGEEKVEAIQLHKFDDKKERIKYLKTQGSKEVCKQKEKDCDPEDIIIKKVTSLGNLEANKMRKEVRENTKNLKEMHSSEIVAYACDGEVYHVDCIDDASDCYPVFAGEEWDYSPTCPECGDNIEELGEEEEMEIQGREEEYEMYLEGKKPRLTEAEIEKQLADLVKESFVDADSEVMCEVRLAVSGHKADIKESLGLMAKDMDITFNLEESADLLSYFINDETKALSFENGIKEHFKEELEKNILRVM
jgi:hypothetical protein